MLRGDTGDVIKSARGAFVVRLRDRVIVMSKSRRLRRLVPDEALYDRRVAGETLRVLARDYGVVHSTLSRHFRRAEAVLELREAHRRLGAERKARQAEERHLKQEVQNRAREDEARDRRIEAWKPPKRSYASDEMRWLDSRDAPRGLTSRQRYSANAWTAVEVVASGGGVEQVVEATGLTRDHVLRRMDSQIARGAIANDRKFPWNARPDNSRLRRLGPDRELIRRRAAGETLRSLAAAYGVSHTTLSRYFNRAAVAKQLHASSRRSHRRQRS